MSMLPTTTDTFRALIKPTDYSSTKTKALIERGYDHWTVDGEQQTDTLAADIETVGEKAIAIDTEDTYPAQPIFTEPEPLITASTLAAATVLTYDLFMERRKSDVQPYIRIREIATQNVLTLIDSLPDDELTDLAELVFEKPPGEDGIHPGRVCTGIRRDHSFEKDMPYLKIPLVAARRPFYERSGDGENTSLNAVLDDNAIFIPLSRLFDTLETDWADAFDHFVEYQLDHLSSDQFQWLHAEASQIDTLLERIENANHHEWLYHNWDPVADKIRFLTTVIKDAPDDVVQLAEPCTANELKTALNTYEFSDHEAEYRSEFASSRKIASFLHDQADRNAIEVIEGNVTDVYKIRPHNSNAKAIAFDHVEDLLELPCFQNLFEEMERNGPNHNDLMNFVATAKWTTTYRAGQTSDLVADVKEVLSRFSWFDEQTTDYQTSYEDKQRDYYPKRCGHRDMQSYCIGIHECPYNIYESLPFAQELYDRLSDE